MSGMRKAVGFFLLFMTVSLLLSAVEPVRIADATPAGDSAVSSLALQLALEKPGKYDISIERLSAEKALAKFNSGRADLVLIREVKLPEGQRNGILHPYAVGAAVFYVNPANPLDDVTPEHLIQLLSGPAPDWARVTGEKTRLYRLGLRRNAAGYGLPERMLKVKPGEFDKDMFRVGSNAELQLLTAGSAEALGAGIFSAVMPDTVKTLKINGVAPLLKTVKDGSYPFCERYILLVPAAPSRAVAAFVELMHGADFRRYLEESGRLSLLP